MLRKLVLIASVIFILTGLIGFKQQNPRLIPLLPWGVVILIAVGFERWRYSRSDLPNEDQWETTGERFIDPGNGKLVVVYHCNSTGERRYVEAPPPNS